jgi:ribose 5-phosphate isomerase A
MASETGSGVANSAEQREWKKKAGEAAAKLVDSGMIVGLGTGSTAMWFIEALGRRVAEEGLNFTGIATSVETEDRALSAGIPLATFAQYTKLDLDVDGADEIEVGTLNLIKGMGGALLREKIVAAASDRFIVIGDESKVVEKLGTQTAVPVEVTQFGWQATAKRLAALGAETTLRVDRAGKAFVTDGGNYIVDCAFGVMQNAKETAHHLDHVVGAVEHGLFLGFAREAIVCGHDGVQVLRRAEAK